MARGHVARTATGPLVSYAPSRQLEVCEAPLRGPLLWCGWGLAWTGGLGYEDGARTLDYRYSLRGSCREAGWGGGAEAGKPPTGSDAFLCVGAACLK